MKTMQQVQCMCECTRQGCDLQAADMGGAPCSCSVQLAFEEGGNQAIDMEGFRYYHERREG